MKITPFSKSAQKIAKKSDDHFLGGGCDNYHKKMALRILKSTSRKHRLQLQALLKHQEVSGTEFVFEDYDY